MDLPVADLGGGAARPVELASHDTVRTAAETVSAAYGRAASSARPVRNTGGSYAMCSPKSPRRWSRSGPRSNPPGVDHRFVGM